MNFEDTIIGRPNTIKTYRSLFKKHIEPHCTEFKQMFNWRDWDGESTRIMIHHWQKAKLSAQTQIALLRLLARYIKFKGGPQIEIQHLIRSLKRSQQTTEVRVLTKAQAINLMSACQIMAPKFYPVLLLALHGGLRRGEIFGLQCADIDMLKGRIRVAHSYDGPTKNGKTRFVPMSPELVKTLTEARNLLLRGPNEKVFERHDPNPILRRLCAAKRLPQIRFHDLRHTFATLALESGVSPRQVQAWLGHSNVATTLGIYWNLTNEEAELNFLPEAN